MRADCFDGHSVGAEIESLSKLLAAVATTVPQSSDKEASLLQVTPFLTSVTPNSSTMAAAPVRASVVEQATGQQDYTVDERTSSDPSAPGPASVVAIPQVITRSSTSKRRASGNPFFHGTDPIAQLEEDLTQTGQGPHLAEARLAFVLGAARYAGFCCSINFFGASSLGKTTLVSSVSNWFPPEDVVSLVGVTYAAMTCGFGWDRVTNGNSTTIDLRTKLIVMDEQPSAGADRQLDAALRQATSASVTTRVKMEKGQPVQINLLGPTTVWHCRLDSAFGDYQSSNRMLPIELRNDPKTLGAIVQLAGEEPTSRGRMRRNHRQHIALGWQRHLRSLDSNLAVVIDFANQIHFRPFANQQTPHAPRLIRAVHAAISGVAWLRQAHHAHHPNPGGEGTFIHATVDDYRIAHRLLLEANILDERPHVPAPAMDLLRRWQSLAGSTGNEPVTAPGLYNAVGRCADRGNMTRHIQPLITVEMARELPGRNANRQKLFQLTELGLHSPTVGLLHTLPSPDQISPDGQSDK